MDRIPGHPHALSLAQGPAGIPQTCVSCHRMDLQETWKLRHCGTPGMVTDDSIIHLMLITQHTTHTVEQQRSGGLLGLVTILRDKQNKLCRYNEQPVTIYNNCCKL